MLLLFITFLLWIPATSADMPWLNCNTIKGNLHEKMIRFSRSMEIGDKLTVTGRVAPHANMSYLNLYSGFNSVFIKSPCTIHVRVQYQRNSIIYNSFFGRWGPESFGKQPYLTDSYYTISILRGPKSYRVFMGPNEIKNYPYRNPVGWEIGNMRGYGDWSIDTVTMDCHRPGISTTVDPNATTPTTTPVPTTPVPTTPTTTTAVQVRQNPIAADPNGSANGSDIVVTKPGSSSNSGSNSNSSNSSNNSNNNNSNNGNSNGNHGNSNNGTGSNNSNGNGNGSNGNKNNGNGNSDSGNGNGNGNGMLTAHSCSTGQKE